MFTLIKNANLYSPEHLGTNDVLLADDKIALIDRKIELTGIPLNTIDAGGCAVTPGFIDQHVHITGGGGQTGYASLVPDVSMSELVACGTTTVVGLLGTDGFVKELTTLYAKTKALEDDGLSAYMLTSFYGLPPKTLMSCVADDLIFIDKVIGCKLAMTTAALSPPNWRYCASSTRYASAVSLPAKEVSCIFIWELCPTVSPRCWTSPASIPR